MRTLRVCARKKRSFQENTRFQGKSSTRNEFSNRILEFVGYEHEIEHVDDPIPIHVALGLVGAEGLGDQCQAQDIYHAVAVDIGGILRFYSQIHLPVDIRQRVLRVHPTAGDALHLFGQRDDLGDSAVVLHCPTIRKLADVKAFSPLIHLCLLPHWTP